MKQRVILLVLVCLVGNLLAQSCWAEIEAYRQTPWSPEGNLSSGFYFQAVDLPPVRPGDLVLDEAFFAAARSLPQHLKDKNKAVIELRNKVDELLEKEDFDALENMVATLRTEIPGKLYPLYNALYDELEVLDKNPAAKEQRLLNWIHKYPLSPTPRVALGGLYKEQAWDIRGGGYAYEVKPGNMMDFQQKLEEAWSVMEQAEKLAADDPGYYTTKLTMARGLGLPQEEIQAIFEKGVARFPDYMRLYTRLGQSLLFRWYGDEDDLRRFSEWAASRSNVSDGWGKIHYGWALEPLYSWEMSPQEALAYNLPWPRMKASMISLVKTGEISPAYLQVFCWLAVVNNDKPMAKALFNVIDNKVLSGRWNGRESFMKARDWANSEDTAAFDIALIDAQTTNFYFKRAYDLHEEKHYEEAIELYQKVISLNSSHASAYKNMGNAYWGLSQWDKAAAAYEKAIENNPDDADVYGSLAFVYEKLGKPDKVMAAYQKAIESDPQSYEVSNRLVNWYWEQKQYDEALDVLKQFVARNPNDPMGHYGLGNRYVQQRKPAEALVALNRARALDPDDANIIYYVGLAYELAKDYDRAIEAMQDSFEHDLKSFPVCNRLANLYQLQHHPEKAEALYETFVAKNPENLQGYSALGALYLQQKTPVKAVVMYEKLRVSMPDNLGVASALMRAYVRARRYHDALKLYQTVKDKQKDGDDAIVADMGLLAGQSFENLGRPDEATTAYINGLSWYVTPLPDGGTRVRHIMKDSPADHALAYLKKNNKFPDDLDVLQTDSPYAMQIHMLRQQIRLQPDLLANYVTLGQMYKMDGQLDKAADTYRQILKKEPGFLQGKIFLAECLVQNKDFKAALSVYQDVYRQKPSEDLQRRIEFCEMMLARKKSGSMSEEEVEISQYKLLSEKHPDSFATHNYLANIYRKYRRVDDAVAVYVRFIANNPDKWQGYYALGNLYVEQHKSKEALEVLNRSLALEPDNAVILQYVGMAHQLQQEYAEAIEAFKASYQIQQNNYVKQQIDACEKALTGAKQAGAKQE